MDTAAQNKSFIQPKTIAELLPSLRGIMTKEAIQSMTAKKQPRSTIALTRTNEKILKPMSMAEIEANIIALQPKTPKFAQAASNTNYKKRNWNSSVKIEQKAVSRTANTHTPLKTARKVLNFQQKPKPQVNSSVVNETPKFIKPEVRAKKSQITAKMSIRMSGVCQIPETPVENTKPIRNKATRVTLANKENNARHNNVKRVFPMQANSPIKKIVLPKPVTRLTVPHASDTPLSNASSISSSDASFLQKEKEIMFEEKIKAVTEQTLENIAEVSPPASTPFKEYRSIQEYFNNSTDLENSINDNTIMCFDNPSFCKDSGRDESVIVSLCDLFTKATVTSEKTSDSLDDFLEMEKQFEQNIAIINNGLKNLLDVRKSQIQALNGIKRLINEKRNGDLKLYKDETLKADDIMNMSNKNESSTTNVAVSRTCSVIKSCYKSPTYKIPRKGLCLRKKVFYKSMPNVSSNIKTPIRQADDKALNMYMEMKEQMTFLNTPIVKQSTRDLLDTPAITSHNLQKQLNKLFNESQET